MSHPHALKKFVFLALAVAACMREEPVNPGESAADGRGDPGRPLFSNGGGPNGKYHYVTHTGGLTSGNGDTPANAWTLPHAFSGASTILTPGDTVWLLGGVYTGTYEVTVAGASGAPIVFKQQPGEIAVLRRNAQFAASTTATLRVKPSAVYTEYWDFEITPTTTLPTRTAPEIGDRLPHPVWNEASNTKFVNLILHDGGVAFLNDRDGDGLTPDNVLISGNIIYNNGWDQHPDDNADGPPRGAGHGLYLKNNSTTVPLVIADNIIFNQFGYGIHIYTEPGDFLNNIQVKGNVSFNNGTLSNYTTSANLGALGTPAANSLVFEKNMLYFSPNSVLDPDAGRNMVYRESGDPVGSNNTRNLNYIVGGNPFITGGTTGDGWTTIAADQTATTPWAGNTVLVRTTAGDPQRANVVVYSSSGGNATVDLSGFLNTGDAYEVRNAQNFRTVVTSGTYSGPISLSLAGVTPPQPNGWVAQPSTAPAFNVFVVIKTGGPAAGGATFFGPNTAQGIQTTVVPQGGQCEFKYSVTNPAPGATATVTWPGGSQADDDLDGWVYIATPFGLRDMTVRIDAPGRTSVPSNTVTITAQSSGAPVCML